MTLSEFSYYVRTYGPISLIGFVLFIVFFWVISMFLSRTPTPQTASPEVYEPPFGILEPINFTHSIDYPTQFTMTIDNIEGRPLELAPDASIYFIPPARTRFGYQQTIALMAKATGIDPETQGYELVDTTATYADGLRTLIVDIMNFNFSYELDYKKVPTLFSDTYMPTEIRIKEDAKAFLRQMNTFTPTLAQGTQNIIYRKYDPGTDTFIAVETPEEANVVEVDFFPPDVGGLPVINPKLHNTHTYVTMVYREESAVYIKAQARIFEPEFSRPGAYPLKTGAQAWSELQAGKGTIVFPSEGTTDIVVRDMFLAYYGSDAYQAYLMPVYVFIGDQGFAAFVSAVDNAYVKGAASPTVAPQ